MAVSTDWYDTQFVLARKFAAELLELAKCCVGGFGDPSLLLRPDLDPVMVSLLLEGEAEHDMVNALVGHHEWYAAKIWRSGRFFMHTITFPDDVMIAHISEAYDVKPPLLRFAINRLYREAEIPGLGTVIGGMLLPNRAAITEWASRYDWSEEAMPPTEPAKNP